MAARRAPSSLPANCQSRRPTTTCRSAHSETLLCAASHPSSRKRVKVVLAPGSVLELLPSSALSSARDSRTVARHRRRHQPHILGRFGTPVAWSRLGEPRRPRETAESTLRDNRENSLRVLPTHASIDNSNTAIGNRPSAITLNSGIVVPLGRARRGPVWAGLDSSRTVANVDSIGFVVRCRLHTGVLAPGKL